MRVVVTGGAGQLAQAIQRVWTGHEVLLPSETRLDLSRRDAILDTLSELKPQAVINCAAFTQVDLCETEQDKAMLINGRAVGWLAEGCADAGACLVQVSTDYVFDGTQSRPYREEDPTHPVSVYGASKLLGETEAQRCPDHLVVRTSWLYDAWGVNFYRTMLRLAAQGNPVKVVDDQRGSPTTCRALARQLQRSLDAGTRGILHATCAGETTWFGFARDIFRRHNLAVALSPCTTGEFPRPAPRPAYSVLSGEKRLNLGIDCMPHWQDALGEILSESIEP